VGWCGRVRGDMDLYELSRDRIGAPGVIDLTWVREAAAGRAALAWQGWLVELLERTGLGADAEESSARPATAGSTPTRWPLSAPDTAVAPPAVGGGGAASARASAGRRGGQDHAAAPQAGASAAAAGAPTPDGASTVMAEPAVSPASPVSPVRRESTTSPGQRLLPPLRQRAGSRTTQQGEDATAVRRAEAGPRPAPLITRAGTDSRTPASPGARDAAEGGLRSGASPPATVDAAAPPSSRVLGTKPAGDRPPRAPAAPPYGAPRRDDPVPRRVVAADPPAQRATPVPVGDDGRSPFLLESPPAAHGNASAPVAAPSRGGAPPAPRPPLVPAAPGHGATEPLAGEPPHLGMFSGAHPAGVAPAGPAAPSRLPPARVTATTSAASTSAPSAAVPTTASGLPPWVVPPPAPVQPEPAPSVVVERSLRRLSRRLEAERERTGRSPWR
jgi:hypothetical protein